MKFSRIIALILCLCMVFLLAACGSKQETPAPAGSEDSGEASAPTTDGEGKTMVVAIPDTPPNIDHAVGAATTVQYMLLANCMDCGSNFKFVTSPEDPDCQIPTGYTPDDIVPCLLESWELSEDGSECTYHIRQGVKSAYGNELTSADYAWKFDRHIAMGAVGNVWMVAENVVKDGKVNYEIIDKYTFKVKSEGSNALHEIITSGMFDQVWDSTEAQAHATADDPWATEYINRTACGFGPYYVTEWKAGEQIVIEANPNYFAPLDITKVIFLVVPENANRVAMLESGEIDMALELSNQEIDYLEGVSGVKTINITSNAHDLLIMNEKVCEPFSDVKVRQAVNYAIPHDDIIKTAYFGQASQQASVGARLFGQSVDKSEWIYSYDLDKAKALMAESAYPDGFSVELYYNADWPAHESAALLLQKSLANIGIKVDLRATPAGTYDTQSRTYQLPMAIIHEYAALPNLAFEMTLHYLSTELGGAYGAFGYYSSKTTDDLLLAAAGTADQAQYVHDAEINIMNDAAYGWMVDTNYTCAIRDNINGFNWDDSMGTYFKMMTKD